MPRDNGKKNMEGDIGKERCVTTHFFPNLRHSTPQCLRSTRRDHHHGAAGDHHDTTNGNHYDTTDNNGTFR